MVRSLQKRLSGLSISASGCHPGNPFTCLNIYNLMIVNQSGTQLHFFCGRLQDAQSSVAKMDFITALHVFLDIFAKWIQIKRQYSGNKCYQSVRFSVDLSAGWYFKYSSCAWDELTTWNWSLFNSVYVVLQFITNTRCHFCAAHSFFCYTFCIKRYINSINRTDGH